jgi:hypothetical protein
VQGAHQPRGYRFEFLVWVAVMHGYASGLVMMHQFKGITQLLPAMGHIMEALFRCNAPQLVEM